MCLANAACESEVNRSRDVHGLYALHMAAKNEDLALMAKLFEEGANANVTDLGGVAPLHRAARNGQTEVARLLLENRADVNMQTEAGWTALQLALWKGHDLMVELLLGFGALPKGNTPEGYNVIHLAAMSGSPYALDLLFRDWKQSRDIAKLDPNAPDKNGKTPLEWALERGHDGAVATLLARRADATFVDQGGNTLIHRLTGTGKLGLAALFFGAGVPLDARNNDGKTAYDLALEKGDAVMAEWLLEALTPAP